MATVTSKKKDVIEIILEDGKSKMFQEWNVEEANTLLRKLGEKIVFCLDFHGVLDLFSVTETICEDHAQICAISFVGEKSKMRPKVREELKQRIRSKQISFAVLVFERTSLPHVVGTKCYVLENLKDKKTNDTRFHFIDDSKDHVESVQAANIPCLEIYHLEETRKDKETIKQKVKKIKKIIFNFSVKK